MATPQEIVQKAVDKWVECNKPDELSKIVTKKLDEARDRIILQVLGFEADVWTVRREGWKIDHCNGRMTVTTKMIQRVALENAEAWLAQAFQRLPELTPEMEEAILKDYKNTFLRIVEDRMRRMAERGASEYTARLIKEVAEQKFEEKIKIVLPDEFKTWAE